MTDREIPNDQIPCEACGLPWTNDEPCARPDGTKYGPNVPHVKSVICDCKRCVEARTRGAERTACTVCSGEDGSTWRGLPWANCAYCAGTGLIATSRTVL